MDNIGNIFAAYRKNLKYSQQDICDKLTGMGIPTKPAAYSTWETGNSIPNAVQFLAMCKILGITDIFNQFIGGHNPNDPMAELNEEGRTMALNYIDLLVPFYIAFTLLCKLRKLVSRLLHRPFKVCKRHIQSLY